MFYDPELLDALEALTPTRWTGEVWRAVLADTAPIRANTRGARWNPPEVAAIYTSLEERVAIQELEYLLSIQPIPTKVPITTALISVELQRVIDLRNDEALSLLKLTPEDLVSDDHSRCQQVGGAVAWLENDGLLVRSARAQGSNLVIYENNRSPKDELQVLDTKVQEP